mmetsp:Transcript_7225/g.13700  ORF Transcript_7225/g.13700 Transcript_7225/m.13700 type:complete len:389 (+) Transcript_7225:67-1233(+)
MDRTSTEGGDTTAVASVDSLSGEPAIQDGVHETKTSLEKVSISSVLSATGDIEGDAGEDNSDERRADRTGSDEDNGNDDSCENKSSEKSVEEIQQAKAEEGKHTPDNAEAVNKYRKELLQKLRAEAEEEKQKRASSNEKEDSSGDDDDDHHFSKVNFCDPLTQGPSTVEHRYRPPPAEKHNLMKHAFRQRQIKLARKKGRIVNPSMSAMDLEAAAKTAHANEVFAESGAWDHLMNWVKDEDKAAADGSSTANNSICLGSARDMRAAAQNRRNRGKVLGPPSGSQRASLSSLAASGNSSVAHLSGGALPLLATGVARSVTAPADLGQTVPAGLPREAPGNKSTGAEEVSATIQAPSTQPPDQPVMSESQLMRIKAQNRRRGRQGASQGF